MANREELEQKIAALEASKVALFDSGSADPVAVGRLNAQINEERQLLNAIDKKNAIIAEVNDPESSFSLTVGDYTVDFRVEAANEQSYQALSVVTQLKLQELEQHNQAEIKALKSSYDSERQQYDMQIDSLESLKVEAQQVIEGYKRDLRELDGHLYNANLQIADRDSKLAIAANEIDSLKSQVEELRNQVSKPTVPTNLDNTALADVMEKLRASRPAIYGVVEINGTKSTAVLVETNETIEFHPNYIGKYRVVSFVEAMQIRAELDAQKEDIPESYELNQSDLEQVATIEPPTQFHAEVSDENTGNELVGDTATLEGVQDHDGESFEQEVRRRLNVLEYSVNVNLSDAIQILSDRTGGAINPDELGDLSERVKAVA